MIQRQSLQNCAYCVAALAVSAGMLTSSEGVLAQLSVPIPTRSPIVTPSAIDPQILGQWRVISAPPDLEFMGATVIFAPNGKLYSRPSKGTAQEFKYFEAQYRVNPLTQPRQLDIFTVFKDGSRETTRTIYEFTSSGQLRLSLTKGQLYLPRPTALDDKSSVLQKISNETRIPSEIILKQAQDEQIENRQTKAKFWIKAINREQQIWALEKNQFASQINNLALVAKLPKSEYYRYGITEIDPQRLVQNTAVAERDRLKSYVGLVYLQRSLSVTTLIELVCESNQPTQQPPGNPTIEGEVIHCPIGYSPVDAPTKATREFNEGFSVRD
jgi:Type IV pilin-like G and H, putative